MSNKTYIDNYNYLSFLRKYKTRFYNIDRGIIFQNKYSETASYNKNDTIQELDNNYLIRNYISLTDNNIGNNYLTDKTNWQVGDVVEFFLSEDDFNTAKQYAKDNCYWFFDLKDNANYNLIFELYIACFLYNKSKGITTEQITSSSIKDMSLGSSINEFFLGNPFFNNTFGKELVLLLQTYYSDLAFGVNDLIRTKTYIDF